MTDALRGFVEMMASAGSSGARFVVEHGREFERKPNPLGFGRLKECYTNSATNAIFNDDYQYAEGWAIGASGIPVHHAWLVDPADGKAIDVTWRDGGDICGFCDGEKVETIHLCAVCGFDQEDCGHDEFEDGYEEAERTCPHCLGSGKQAWEHTPYDQVAYFGVVIPADLVHDAVQERRLWEPMLQDDFLPRIASSILRDEGETPTEGAPCP